MRLAVHRVSTAGRTRCLLVLVALAGCVVPARAQEERPDVHTDYRYGIFPYRPDALERFADEDMRLMMSAFHRGWSLDKFIDESERPEVDILTLLQRLEDDRLVRGENDWDLRPGFPVIREDELIEVMPLVQSLADGLVDLFEGQWDEVEEFVASLEAGREFPREQVLYRFVVGGVLLGSMVEVLFDDQTLMPGPPRRARRGGGYYAWMTEGSSGPTQLVRQAAQVGRHQVISIGPLAVDEPRVEIQELARTDPVYEYEDARRWRVFGRILSRDHLLPYMKSRRSEIRDTHSELDASRYTALAEFVAWLYTSAAAEATTQLAASGRIVSPETSFRYALRSDR